MSSVEIWLTALTIASTEPWTSALTTSGNSIACLSLQRGEHVLEAGRRGGGALAVDHALAIGGDLAGARLVLDDASACRPRDGTPERPSTSTGTRRAGFLHLRPLSSIIARTLPLIGADDEDVADLQRAALDEHGGERAAALVELGLDHRAFGGAVGIGLQLEQFGLELRSPRAARRDRSS